MGKKDVLVIRDYAVVKKGDNLFKVIYPSGGGAILDMDLDGLLLLKAIPGSQSLKDRLKRARKMGVNGTDAQIKKAIRQIEKSGILTDREQIVYPFNFDKVLKNARKFPKNSILSMSELEISVTNECPYRCVYCYRAIPVKEKVISISLMKQAIKDGALFGCRSLIFTGGEPSLGKAFKDVEKLAKYAKSIGYGDISVNTSGIGLDSRKMVRWKKAGVDSLTIKLDSYNDKTVSKLTGYEDAFKKAASAISVGSKIFDEVVVNITLTEQNFQDIEKTVKLSLSLGAKSVKVTPTVPFGRGTGSEISLKNMKKTAILCQKMMKKLGGRKVLCPIKVRNRAYSSPLICLAGITRVFVKEDGNVYPCTYLSDKWKLGNISKERLKAIWSKSAILDDYFRKKTPINKKCGNCNIREYCIDTCKAMAEAYFKDLNMEKEPKECLYEPQRNQRAR